MYKARVFYNNGAVAEFLCSDLTNLKDVFCTFSFPRTDVEVVKVYKEVDGKLKVIGKILKGRYDERLT